MFATAKVLEFTVNSEIANSAIAQQGPANSQMMAMARILGARSLCNQKLLKFSWCCCLHVCARPVNMTIAQHYYNKHPLHCCTLRIATKWSAAMQSDVPGRK